MDLGLIITVGVLIAAAFYARQFGAAAFFMAVFLVIPFPLSIGGGEQSGLNICPADCLIALMCFHLFYTFGTRRRLALGPVAIPLLCFLLIAAISSAMNWRDGTAVSLGRMFLGTVVATLIFANANQPLSTFRRCFDAYLVSAGILSFVALGYFLAFGFKGSQYTLGIHKNALGPIFGTGVALAMAFLSTDLPGDGRRRFTVSALGASTMGAVFSLSRGAWIATVAACVLILFLTGRVKAFIGSLLILIPTIAIIWMFLPEEATNYATDVSPDTYVISSRFDAMDAVINNWRKSPLFGVGVGLRKAVEPHNVLVLTLGETGIVGVVAFVFAFGAGFYTLLLAWRRAQGSAQARQIVMAAAAAFLLTTVHGMMDVYWRRGVSIIGWAGVGMAVSVMQIIPPPARAGSVLRRPPRRRSVPV